MKINLDCIRDVLIDIEEHFWNKTKSIISKVGSHTLEFIEDTAQKIAIEYAKSLINSVPINTPSNTK